MQVLPVLSICEYYLVPCRFLSMIVMNTHHFMLVSIVKKLLGFLNMAFLAFLPNLIKGI